MSRSHRAAVLAVAALALAVLNLSLAQEAAAPAPAPAVPAVTAAAPAAGTTSVTKTQAFGREMTLWGMFVVGGWCMWPLLALSIAGVGLTVYAAIAVRTGRMLRPDLVPGLQSELDQLHLDKAREMCTVAPCLLTNTLSAGLERISDGVLDMESMEKAMEEHSLQEITAGMRPINYISIVAQLAPMWGLLGTVSGMIKAFEKIGLGAMGKPEMLASDIGEALITTAAGLFIAIPAMFAYFYYKSKYATCVSEMNRILGNLTHRMVLTARRQSPDKLVEKAG